MRSKSRGKGSGSLGRPSSKWRDGYTQDEIEQADEDSALNALELAKQGLVYPDWWEGKDEIEKEEI